MRHIIPSKTYKNTKVLSVLMLASAWGGVAQASGLGDLRLQSALGQIFQAQAQLIGDTEDEAASHCIKARLELPDGNFVAVLTVNLEQSGDQKIVNLRSRQTVREPVVAVIVENLCGAPVRKAYLQLLDPPVLGALARDRETVAAATVGESVQQPTPVEKTVARREDGKRERATKAVLVPTVVHGKKTHDTLRLSDDVSLQQEHGLRLTGTLAQPNEQATSDELRAAQQQLMAILRGEDPGLSAQAQLKVGDARIASLQNELSQLRQQNQTDKVALDAAREGGAAKGWIYALIGLLVAGVAVLGYFLLRVMRMAQQKDVSWWEQKQDKPEQPEARKNLEELVNSIQASYGPTTRPQTDEGGLPEITIDPPSINPPVITTTPKQYSLREDTVPVATTIRRDLPSLEDTNSSSFNFFPNRGNSMRVDEILDATQEAEFWMSVNDPGRAIAILEPQARDENPQSPVPWLYLLDLYKATQNRDKYEELRERFIVYFNANVPAFDAPDQSGNARQLEDFGHLLQKICSLWNSSEILPFLESLLVDDRGGSRLGFELPVYRDILLLIAIANELERIKAFGLSPEDDWTTVR